MVWTAPITFYDGDPLTAAQLNTFVRDNMMETGPGKAVRDSQLLVTDNVNLVSPRQWARAIDKTIITVDSEFPTAEGKEDGVDDPVTGPTVTVAHGGAMLIFYDARIRILSGDASAAYAPVVDGQSPENTATAVRSDHTYFARAGSCTYVDLGEPGISEVSVAYGVLNNSTTAQYALRRLTVLPF